MVAKTGWPVSYQRSPNYQILYEKASNWICAKIFGGQPLFTRCWSSYVRVAILTALIFSIFRALKVLHETLWPKKSKEKVDAIKPVKTLLDKGHGMSLSPHTSWQADFFDETDSTVSSTVTKIGGSPFRREVRGLLRQFKSSAGEQRLNGGDEDSEEESSEELEEKSIVGDISTSDSSFSVDVGFRVKKNHSTCHCEICEELKLVEIDWDDSLCMDNIAEKQSTTLLHPINGDSSKIVTLTGSFLGWTTKVALRHPEHSQHTLKASPSMAVNKMESVKFRLPAGHHEFIFIVGSKPVLSSRFVKCLDLAGLEKFNAIDL